MKLDALRNQLLFAGLAQEDLIWLERMSESIAIEAGEYLMKEGEESDALFIAAEGDFEVVKRSGDQDVVIAHRGAGEIFGEMSLLDGTPHTASVRALEPAHLFRISGAVFRDLLATRPQATLAILKTVTARLRQTEAMLRQNEKMAALGTLSAGLAHELNNPAAAAKRSAALLATTLSEWQELTSRLDDAAFDPPQRSALAALRARVAERRSAPANLDPLTRSDRESEIQEWLEAREVDRAWEIAPALVAGGWDLAALEELAKTFGARLTLVAQWMGLGGQAYGLLDEVGQSAERISEIVKAVKSYSYLDQAPIQEVDVHAGLENTLVILKHKLKQGVQVTRDYAPDLPHIEAYGSQLNQVWTNIIDNAIDAMQGQGSLTIRTRAAGDGVAVEIGDSGPGIPDKVKSRLFEPFFTTKPPGVGTGLGLHVSYNIVERHHGKIEIDSQPGATIFRVTLPRQLKRGQG